LLDQVVLPLCLLFFTDPMHALQNLTGGPPAGATAMGMTSRPQAPTLGGMSGIGTPMGQQMSLPGQQPPGTSGMTAHGIPGISAANQPSQLQLQQMAQQQQQQFQQQQQQQQQAAMQQQQFQAQQTAMQQQFQVQQQVAAVAAAQQQQQQMQAVQQQQQHMLKLQLHQQSQQQVMEKAVLSGFLTESVQHNGQLQTCIIFDWG
ncbi:Mediator of RNA polymerase II transcription subunit 15, partial [Varanus komodoensis]